MNRTASALILVLCAAALTRPVYASEEEKAPQGKSLFIKYKCRSCHSIQSAGIKKSGPTSKTARRKPPDLSGVGLERDHEWIENWLQKKEKLEGRLHPIRFRGTKDEREALAAWLETMKTPKSAESGKAGATQPGGTAEPGGATQPAAAPPAADTTHAR